MPPVCVLNQRGIILQSTRVTSLHQAKLSGASIYSCQSAHIRCCIRRSKQLALSAQSAGAASQDATVPAAATEQDAAESRPQPLHAAKGPDQEQTLQESRTPADHSKAKAAVRWCASAEL